MTLVMLNAKKWLIGILSQSKKRIFLKIVFDPTFGFSVRKGEVTIESIKCSRVFLTDVLAEILPEFNSVCCWDGDSTRMTYVVRANINARNCCYTINNPLAVEIDSLLNGLHS